MHITKIEDLKTLHHQSLDLGNEVLENRYLHIMIVLANLANTMTSLESEENTAVLRTELLSQYKEGIQSILLLGEECGFEAEWMEDYPHIKVNGDLSTHLMQLLEAIALFRVKKSAIMYKALLSQYLQLGKMLGIELEDITIESLQS
ncbi:hypothetical protein IEO70_08270 [Bacillus sp. AGMB 02131]|uniref:dUTPase n=1 Tax=Peribacillus faecalis TaxID=2772559 RepID=A0A927CZ12_9BACI|nr:hypothetical protein [Peribacillus faecalis]MBD3108360.1 hypothetical protein [Peribacillus faecalis]